MNPNHPVVLAMREAQAGHPDRAIAQLQTAVDAAAARHGARSLPHATALRDLATLLAALGATEAAADALAAAAQVQQVGPESDRLRELCQLNLGEVLIALGRMDAAGQVLRQALADREHNHGAAHPITAAAAIALGEWEFATGAPDNAAARIGEQIDTLRADGREQLPAALCLLGFAQAAVDGPTSFSSLTPEDPIEDVVGQALHRVQRHPPELGLVALGSLLPRVVGARGRGWPGAWQLAAGLAATARAAHRADVAAQTFDWLVDALDAHGTPAQATEARLGRALARTEAGQTAFAESDYRDVIARSETHDLPALCSTAWRDLALLQADDGRPGEASVSFLRALRAAVKAGATTQAARVRIASGIFEQHQGRPVEARDLMEAGRAMLPSDDPDARHATTHLQAMADGTPCGCFPNAERNKQLFDRVNPHVAPGLIQHLNLTDDGELELTLNRKPTPEEEARLQQILQAALATMGKQMGQA